MLFGCLKFWVFTIFFDRANVSHYQSSAIYSIEHFTDIILNVSFLNAEMGGGGFNENMKSNLILEVRETKGEVGKKKVDSLSARRSSQW